MTNLLLVDDDEVDVMTVRRAFKKNNITNPFYIASNGLEALAMLRGEGDSPPIPQERRLILLDLNMPKMGGIEFLRELRADPKLRLIPVIVLTTSNEDKDKVEAYNLKCGRLYCQTRYIYQICGSSGYIESVLDD